MTTSPFRAPVVPWTQTTRDRSALWRSARRMLAVTGVLACCGCGGDDDGQTSIATSTPLIAASRTATLPPATASARPTGTQSAASPTATSAPGTPVPTTTQVATPSATPGVGTPSATADAATATATATLGETSTPGVGTPTATPTPTPGNGQADLRPQSLVVIAPTPEGGCINDPSELVLSLELCVRNDGDGDAGPFAAEIRIVSGVTVAFEGAAAASEVCAEAPLVDGQVEVEVDIGEAVAETDESNNTAVFPVVRPTLPPLCATPAALR